MIVSIKNQDICDQLMQRVPLLADCNLSPDDEFEIASYTGIPLPWQQLFNDYEPHKWVKVISVNPVHRFPNGAPLFIYLHNNMYNVKGTLKKKKRSKKKKKPKNKKLTKEGKKWAKEASKLMKDPK